MCVWVPWCGGYIIRADFSLPRGCGFGDVEVHVEDGSVVSPARSIEVYRRLLTICFKAASVS